LRESPIGKKVSFFSTCLIDFIYPETGLSAIKVLEYLGVEVEVPEEQTCCGQPAYNGGYFNEARAIAAHFLHTFKGAEVIVTPSGSCAAMVRHEYPRLFAGDQEWEGLAQRVASRTWEFAEFIVDGLGISDLNVELSDEKTLAVHDSCHGLRFLGLGKAQRCLLGNIINVSLIEMKGHDECCGFGGLFSVKMADISGVMLEKKIDNIENCLADLIVSTDVSCLMHINGGLERKGYKKRVLHLADILSGALEKGEPGG
jgi:L-lactate dehydrogenase complex protein LldE